MDDDGRRTRMRWMAMLLLVAVTGACDGNGNGEDTGGHDADVTADDGADVPGADADGDADAAEDAADDVEDAACRTEVPEPCTPATTECLGPACHAPPYATTCVSGTVGDEHGAPLHCQAVALCVPGHCFFTTADADGYFSARIPAGSSIDELALYFPSSPPRLSPFCRYQELCDGAIHLCDDYRLYPAPTAGTDVGTGALAAEARVEASDRAAMILAAGDEVLLPIDAPTTEVALTRFPLDEHVPCFIDPASPPLALYVVTPLDTFLIEPGTMVHPVLRFAALDLPNETGLAAGAEVDVFVLGGSHATDAGLVEGE
jgi:hypothetical protein